MAKPFTGFTRQEQKEIRQALSEQHLKQNADWRGRILADITTVTMDLYEGESVPGNVAYPATEKRKLKAFNKRLEAAVQAYEQLGERLQWHLDDQLGRSQRLNLPDALNTALSAARLAAEKPNPHVHIQKKGAPKNHAMRLAVTALLEIFEKATGIEPKVYATAHNNKADYAGSFYPFAVACLRPVGLIPRKQLGSAILAEYKEWKRAKLKK